MDSIKQKIKQQLSIIADATHEISGYTENEMFDTTDNQIEQWKCIACGDLPCIITINYTPNKEAFGYERFQNRECLCKHDEPDWKQVIS